jgi:hypothetical protein
MIQIMDCNLYRRKLSWPDLRYCTGICLGRRKNHDKPETGYPVYGSRFELGTFPHEYEKLVPTTGLTLATLALRKAVARLWRKLHKKELYNLS